MDWQITGIIFFVILIFLVIQIVRLKDNRLPDEEETIPENKTTRGYDLKPGNNGNE